MTGTRMLQRRGTAAEWAEDNPILGDGEIGWERDTHIIKVGDGVTAWNALQQEYLPFKDSEFLVPGKLTVESALTSIFKQPGTTVGVHFEPNGNDTNLVVRTTADGTAKILLASNQLLVNVPLFLHNNLELHGPGSGLRIYARDNDGIDFELYSAAEAFQIWCAETGQNVLTIDRLGNIISIGRVKATPGVGYGEVDLVPGTSDNSGYVSFQLPNGNRAGYIGWAANGSGPDLGILVHVAAEHDFTGRIKAVPLDILDQAFWAAALEVQGNATAHPRIAFVHSGVAAGQVRYRSDIIAFEMVNDEGTTWVDFLAGAVLDHGTRVYSQNNPDLTRVAKAGDTMTGDLTLMAANVVLEQAGAANRFRFTTVPGAQYIQADDEVRLTHPFSEALQTFKAGSIYDGGNRVYSALNPPPGGGGGSSINQTQRGTVTINSGSNSATVTITTVNMAKSQLRYLGSTSSTGDARIELTNSTTITATRSTTTPTITAGYDLTEWI